MRPCANKDLGSCIMPGVCVCVCVMSVSARSTNYFIVSTALVRFTPSVCQASATTSLVQSFVDEADVLAPEWWLVQA